MAYWNLFGIGKELSKRQSAYLCKLEFTVGTELLPQGLVFGEARKEIIIFVTMKSRKWNFESLSEQPHKLHSSINSLVPRALRVRSTGRALRTRLLYQQAISELAFASVSKRVPSAKPFIWKSVRFIHTLILVHLSSGQTDSQVDASFGLAFNLRFVWPPTCVDFGRAQIWTQADASIFTVWPPSASRHKLSASNLLW